jgi:uncharacterized membrane protein
MDGNFLLALTVHILGFTFWVGGLFTLATLMSAAGDEPTLRAKVGAIARRVARGTDAAAGVAIVGGVVLLTMNTRDLREPWMHMKLTFVFGLLAVHGIVRVRAKKLADGGPAPRPMATLAVVALAVAIIALVVFKPMNR